MSSSRRPWYTTWNSPNLYNDMYSPVPDCPGVYVLVGANIDERRNITETVCYIGSSKRLSLRLSHHAVLQSIAEKFWNVRIFFKTLSNYIEVERRMIRKHRPSYNSHLYLGR